MNYYLWTIMTILPQSGNIPGDKRETSQNCNDRNKETDLYMSYLILYE